MSVNKVILVGRLGRDPEERYTANQQPICSYAVATSRRYKDKEGNTQEQTEWHNISMFGNQMTMLGSKDGGGSNSNDSGMSQTASASSSKPMPSSNEPTTAPAASSFDEFEDDIPF